MSIFWNVRKIYKVCFSVNKSMYYLDYVTLFVGLTVLLIGSITDIKKREVPDWISHGLIYFGFAYGIIKSVIYWSINPIIASIVGFIIFFGIGYLMYIFGQWGGGDTKILMGLGSLVGISIIGNEKNFFLLTFIVNVLFVGAIYGFLWSIGLAIRKRQIFIKTLKEFTLQKGILKLRVTVLIFSITGLVLLLFLPPQIRLIIFAVVCLIFLIFYVWIFVKVTEKSCMIKEVEVDKLTEGDWILDSIVLDKRKFLNTKNKILGEKNLKIIENFYKNNDPYVPITKKILFLNFNTKKKLSCIQEGDEISKRLRIGNLLIEKGQIIDADDIYKFNKFIRKNSLTDVNIKKSYFFGNYIRKVSPDTLRSSDYLLEDIEKAYIVCSPKDLGVSKEQILDLIELKKIGKIKKILVKEGIPFVPSFFIAFIFNIFAGQWFLLFYK